MVYCKELTNLNVLTFSLNDKNSNLIAEKFPNDIEYFYPPLQIFFNKIGNSTLITSVLIDENIKDNKIHIRSDHLAYLIETYETISSIDDLKIGLDYKEIDCEFVIDDSLNSMSFYIGDNENIEKMVFYIRINNLNRNEIFRLIDKKFISFDVPNNYAILNYEENSTMDKLILHKIKIIDQIVDDHNNPSVKLRLETLIIFLFISFTGILLMLLTSIRRSESKNIKILEREGYQRYEINFIIYGPYLIMLLFGLIIGKIFSFYLYPSKDVFGFIAYFIPENFMFYLFYFTIIWGISYFYSRWKLKWEI